MAVPVDGIQCQHRADECKSFQFSRHWCIHIWEPTALICLWVHTCLSSMSCSFYFMRWEASGHTPSILWSAASRICSKQYVALLHTSDQGSSPGTLLESSQTRILTWQPLRIPVFWAFLSERVNFHMVNNLFVNKGLWLSNAYVDIAFSR